MSPRGSILVIDDAPETLGLLDSVLEGAGYTVLMAQNAHAAFTRLREAEDRIVAGVVELAAGGQRHPDLARQSRKSLEQSVSGYALTYIWTCRSRGLQRVWP